MKLLAFLCLSGAAASPATHALGARLHDTVIASEHASAPFFVAACNRSPLASAPHDV